MPKCSVERAKKVLEENLEIDPWSRLFFEAVAGETLSTYYQKRLLFARDCHFDQTPPVDVRLLIDAGNPTDRLVQYKCQRGFVIGLRHDLEGMIEYEVVGGRTRKVVEQFLKDNMEFEVGRPENQKRIRKINRVINVALKGIKRRD